jgi:hypothetical protein
MLMNTGSYLIHKVEEYRIVLIHHKSYKLKRRVKMRSLMI